MTIFKEEEHPRDGDGKFTKDDNESKVIVDSNALGNYINVKELRQKASDYYRKNLQGIDVEKIGIGKIRFSGKGLREFIAFSGNEDKLKMMPYLKEIITNGKIGEFRKLEHPRKDEIIGFYPLQSSVILDGKVKEVETLIAKDVYGNLFYDIFVDRSKKERTHSRYSHNNCKSAMGDNNSIVKNSSDVKQNLQLNLFITSETYLTESDRIIIANKKYSLDNSKK
jgi:hypothetical protein